MAVTNAQILNEALISGSHAEMELPGQWSRSDLSDAGSMGLAKGTSKGFESSKWWARQALIAGLLLEVLSRSMAGFVTLLLLHAASCLWSKVHLPFRLNHLSKHAAQQLKRLTLPTASRAMLQNALITALVLEACLQHSGRMLAAAGVAAALMCRAPKLLTAIVNCSRNVLVFWPAAMRGALQKLLIAVLALEACLQCKPWTVLAAAAASVLLYFASRLAREVGPIRLDRLLEVAVVPCGSVKRCLPAQPQRLLLMALVAEVLLTLVRRPDVLCRLLLISMLLGVTLTAVLGVSRLLKNPAAVEAASETSAELLLSMKFAMQSMRTLRFLPWQQDQQEDDPWQPMPFPMASHLSALSGGHVHSSIHAGFVTDPVTWRPAAMEQAFLPCFPAAVSSGHGFAAGGVGACATALGSFATQAADSTASAMEHGFSAACSMAPQVKEVAGATAQKSVALAAALVDSFGRLSSSSRQLLACAAVKKSPEQKVSQPCQATGSGQQVQPMISPEGEALKNGNKRVLAAPDTQQEAKFAAALAAAQKRRRLCKKASAA